MPVLDEPRDTFNFNCKPTISDPELLGLAVVGNTECSDPKHTSL